LDHHHHHHHHPVLVTKPQFSLLRLSATERLMGVALLVLLLWVIVWWALT
jgi:hypothetical protein